MDQLFKLKDKMYKLKKLKEELYKSSDIITKEKCISIVDEYDEFASDLLNKLMDVWDLILKSKDNELKLKLKKLYEKRDSCK